MKERQTDTDKRRAELATYGSSIAVKIKSILPPGVGFLALVFDFGPGGDTVYVSNAQRDTMIEALCEFLRVHGAVPPRPCGDHRTALEGLRALMQRIIDDATRNGRCESALFGDYPTWLAALDAVLAPPTAVELPPRPAPRPDASPLDWTCIVCGDRHPIDHAGLYLGQFMACLSCEPKVRERALRTRPEPESEASALTIPEDVPLEQARDAGRLAMVPRALLRRLLGNLQFLAACTEAAGDTARPQLKAVIDYWVGRTWRHVSLLGEAATIDIDHEDLDD